MRTATGGETRGASAAPGRQRRAAAARSELAVQRLERLNDIARLLASFETVEQTFDAAIAVAARVLRLDGAILVEQTDGGRRLTSWSPDERNREPTREASAHLEAALSYLLGAKSEGASRTGQEVVQAPAGQAVDATGSRRFIVLPLVVASRPVFGALQMEGTGFDKQDLVFVNAVANQFAVALDRDRAWRRDIARREHAEVTKETLRTQAEALMAADRQRSEFLSALADELRTSLACSREIQQSMRTVAGSEKVDRAIRTMSGQIQQTAQLIDDLHGLSSLTRAQVQIQKARVEIGAILDQAAKQGGARLGARGQTLTISLPSGPAYVWADAARIEQVFETLIDKASLLASPGGRIWLTARVVAGGNGDPALPGGWGGPQVVVRLRDDGAGDVKSILPRVFDLLNPAGRRVDPTDARLGSGLMLMRRIVELHGGAVAATSSGLGQGSEFELRLPIGGGSEALLRPERRSS